MANRKKEDRVSDVDIRRLNHMGLGLKAIADLLGCHPATITLRLNAMGLKPTDTRRSFMEKVYTDLPGDAQEWLSHNLYNSNISVDMFVTRLITEAFNAQHKTEVEHKPAKTAVAPIPVPEMDGGASAPVPLVPKPDELTLGEYEAGGVSEKPDPAQTLEPEKLAEVPVSELPRTVPEPRKLAFR